MNPIDALIATGNRLAILALSHQSTHADDIVRKWKAARDAARMDLDARDDLTVRMYEALAGPNFNHHTPAQRSAMVEFQRRFRSDDGENWTRREEA